MVYRYTKPFREVVNADVALVGGKVASLGELHQRLTPLGIRVPHGFAVTAAAYDAFIDANQLQVVLDQLLAQVNVDDLAELQQRAALIRTRMVAAELPAAVREEITARYHELQREYGAPTALVVRSSATAEDTATASFAGEQESYLNILGVEAVLARVRDCYASLFTDRAIAYRLRRGIDYRQVKIAVGIQHMVRADLASAGVIFTIEPDTGLTSVVVINASVGLGEFMVRGRVNPDEFIVAKEPLQRGFRAIITRRLGEKLRKVICLDGTSIQEVATSEIEQRTFALTDEEVLTLTHQALLIEQHYGRPMDIEWAKDGTSGELYIVQARPETVHTPKRSAAATYREFIRRGEGAILARGTAVGDQVAHGPARIIRSLIEAQAFRDGEVIVAVEVDPAWEAIIARASAMVTERGGRTAHAAIVCRELGVPCVIGVAGACDRLPTGETVTVDCANGSQATIYRGEVPFEVVTRHLAAIPKTRTSVFMSLEQPDDGWDRFMVPVSGVGLTRTDLLLAAVGVHPAALAAYDQLMPELRQKIDRLIPSGRYSPADYLVELLAEALARLGVAFAPRPVCIQTSDLPLKAYRDLIGGDWAEDQLPKDARGAERYSHPIYQPAFILEVRALQRAKASWGIENLELVIPACRTIEAGQKIVEIITQHLPRESVRLQLVCEYPENLTDAVSYLKVFDGLMFRAVALPELVGGEKQVAAELERLAGLARSAGKTVTLLSEAAAESRELLAVTVRHDLAISVQPEAVIATIGKLAEQETVISESRQGEAATT